MRLLLAPLAIILAAAPAVAQQPKNADPDQKVQSTGTLPEGWQGRTDRGQSLAEAKFIGMGKGYHATTGPSAVFYNPTWKRSGDYKVTASFTQTKAPAHPEAYGLLLGGNNLTGDDQAYSYFLVRGTGEYFIATRKGPQRTVVQSWTAHDAIKKQDQAGKQTNLLGVEVRGNDVVFTVNSVEVARRPKSEILTDGVFGYRVNHNLDVHIDPVQ